MRWMGWGVVLAGCAEAVSGPDLAAREQAPPPSGGQLAVSAAVVGSPLRLHSAGHPAGSRVFFGRGGAGRTCPSTLAGQCLDLAGASLLGSDTADASGQARLEISVPATLAAGRSTGMQAANTSSGGTVVISNRQEVRTERGTTCAAGEVTLVRNAAFDLPLATGELTQAYGGSTLQRVVDPVRGGEVIEVFGNEDVTVELVPTPVSDLTEAGVWTWHDPGDAAIQSFTVSYDDGTTFSDLVFNTTTGTGWEYIDVLPDLTPGKRVRKFEIWGYMGGGALLDLTRYDDFSFCAR